MFGMTFAGAKTAASTTTTTNDTNEEYTEGIRWYLANEAKLRNKRGIFREQEVEQLIPTISSACLTWQPLYGSSFAML